MAEPVEAFEPPWRDVRATAEAKRKRGRRLVVLLAVIVVGMAAYWLPCWRGRISTCNFWCSAGAAAACNVLARNYDDGNGTDIRDDLAVSYYREACDGGSLTACVNLGIMYENAEGVPPDPFAAAVQYQKACPKKLSACRRMASLMVERHIGADSGDEVARALDDACDGHDDDAMKSCNALARLYDTGVGVRRDDRQAVKLYRRACEGHLDVACYNLSLMYRRGEGIAQDVAQADALKARSCQNSNASRCRD
jgi:TPR repeat protein